METSPRFNHPEIQDWLERAGVVLSEINESDKRRHDKEHELLDHADGLTQSEVDDYFTTGIEPEYDL